MLFIYAIYFKQIIIRSIQIHNIFNYIKLIDRRKGKYIKPNNVILTSLKGLPISINMDHMLKTIFNNLGNSVNSLIKPII